MNLIRKIFSINTAILIFAFGFLGVGIKQVFEIFYPFKKLIHHKGIITEKSFFIEGFIRKDSIKAIKLILLNGEEYTASRYIELVNNLIELGDTVDIYTKEVTSKLGNYITNGNGLVRNTKNEKEIFHLISNRYQEPLIDFYENRKNLLRTIWGFPLGSLCFFGWYFYRRSGKKSPFISERGGWTV